MPHLVAPHMAHQVAMAHLVVLAAMAIPPVVMVHLAATAQVHTE